MPVPDDVLSSGAVPVRDYREIRVELRTGDLLLFSGKARVSGLIKYATRSPWSHVAFVLRIDEVDRVLALESVMVGGVRAVPVSLHVRNVRERRRGYDGQVVLARHARFERAPAVDFTRLPGASFDLLGRAYDWAAVGRLFLRTIFPTALGGRFRRDRQYICSEFVDECYRALGIRVPKGPYGYITPGDFARAAEVRAVAVLRT